MEGTRPGYPGFPEGDDLQAWECSAPPTVSCLFAWRGHPCPLLRSPTPASRHSRVRKVVSLKSVETGSRHVLAGWGLSVGECAGGSWMTRARVRAGGPDRGTSDPRPTDPGIHPTAVTTSATISFPRSGDEPSSWPVLPCRLFRAEPPTRGDRFFPPTSGHGAPWLRRALATLATDDRPRARPPPLHLRPPRFPRRTGRHRRLPGARRRCARIDAHRRRQVAVLPVAGTAARGLRHCCLAADRADAGSGRRAAAAGRARGVPELHPGCRHGR